MASCSWPPRFLALVIANTPLADSYQALLSTTVAVQVGQLIINKPLLLWINDGLMAVFFFLIGLEIKREVMEGELSSVSQVVLPGFGAFGGMAVPAAIFAALNWGDAEALNGWAIPVATDIAFALALVSSFGARAPTSLKVFLLTLAIFDDLAAIIIIAVFYTSKVSLLALAIACRNFGARSHSESFRRDPNLDVRAAGHRDVGGGAEIGCPCDPRRCAHRLLCANARSRWRVAAAGARARSARPGRLWNPANIRLRERRAVACRCRDLGPLANPSPWGFFSV